MKTLPYNVTIISRRVNLLTHRHYVIDIGNTGYIEVKQILHPGFWGPMGSFSQDWQ